MSTLKDLLEDLEMLLNGTLVERVDRRPFKRASSIGPGPRQGWPDGPKHSKRNYWKCRCKNYQCKCKGGGGERKKVKLEPEWKSAYNSEYKAWHRRRLHRAAPGHFIGYNKQDKANKAKRRKNIQKAARKRRIYKR